MQHNFKGGYSPSSKSFSQPQGAFGALSPTNNFVNNLGQPTGSSVPFHNHAVGGFGGGGVSNFGLQSAFGGPAIGAAPQFVTPQPSANPPAFGALGTQQISNTFSTQTQGGFGNQLQGGFGAQNQFATQVQGGFGTPNQFGAQVQGFGTQSQGGFGNQSQASFPTQVQPAFGNQSQGSYFNQTQAGFGGQVQGGFGGQVQAGFGGQVLGGFGGQGQAGFGGQSQGGFGGQGLAGFSAQSQGGFGKQSQAGFGQSASIIPSPYNGNTGIFNSATTTGTTTGTSAPLVSGGMSGFGFTQTPIFGSSGLQIGTHQPPFASNGLAQTGTLSGTNRFTPTKVQQEKNTSGGVTFALVQSISAQQGNKSYEEIRMEDMLARQGSAQGGAGAAGGGSFGAVQPLAGQQSAVPSGFGSTPFAFGTGTQFGSTQFGGTQFGGTQFGANQTAFGTPMKSPLATNPVTPFGPQPQSSTGAGAGTGTTMFGQSQVLTPFGGVVPVSTVGTTKVPTFESKGNNQSAPNTNFGFGMASAPTPSFQMPITNFSSGTTNTFPSLGSTSQPPPSVVPMPTNAEMDSTIILDVLKKKWKNGGSHGLSNVDVLPSPPLLTTAGGMFDQIHTSKKIFPPKFGLLRTTKLSSNGSSNDAAEGSSSVANRMRLKEVQGGGQQPKQLHALPERLNTSSAEPRGTDGKDDTKFVQVGRQNLQSEKYEQRRGEHGGTGDPTTPAAATRLMTISDTPNTPLGIATGLTPAQTKSPEEALAKGGGSPQTQVDTVGRRRHSQAPTPVQKSSFAPHLTKEGYTTSPSIDELQKMSEGELKCVLKFSVQSSHGKIEWENADVRYLDLDEIVEIKHRQVLVYHGRNGEGTNKPREGDGLNKKAKITLRNVKAKQDTKASKEVLTEKIKQNCASSGSTLISFDADAGIWEFEVEHFSKYGLEDDEDDEDELDKTNPPPASAGPAKSATVGDVTLNVDQRQRQAATSGMESEILGRHVRLLDVEEFPESADPSPNHHSHSPSTSHNDAHEGCENDFEETSVTLKDAADREARSLVKISVSEWSSGKMKQLDRSLLLQGAIEKVDTSSSSMETSAKAHARGQPERFVAHSWGAALATNRATPPFAAFSTVTSLPTNNFQSKNSVAIQTVQYSPLEHRPVTAPDFFFSEKLPTAAAGVTPSRVVILESEMQSIVASLGDKASQSESQMRRREQRPTENQGACSRLLREAKHDCRDRFRMGGSFRVGWGPGGKLVHGGIYLSDKQSRCALLTLSKVTSYFPASIAAADRNAAIAGPFECLVNQSSCKRFHPDPNYAVDTSRNPIGTFSITRAGTSSPTMDLEDDSESSRIGEQLAPRSPLWQGPLWQGSVAIEGAEYFLDYLQSCAKIFRERKLGESDPDWTALKVLELFNAALGQEEGVHTQPSRLADDWVPALERREGQEEQCERRQEAISQWFEALCQHEVASQSEVDAGYADESTTFARILELLSCHRLGDAVAVAENAGFFRLATLLSQVDGDAELASKIQHQLDEWEFVLYRDGNGTQGGSYQDDGAIPKELLHIYCLLGGRVISSPYFHVESIVKGWGWVRALGALLWYCREESDSPVKNAISLFADVLEHVPNEVDVPIPRYHSNIGSGRRDSPYRDCLYSLLQYLFISFDSDVNDEGKLKQIMSALESESSTADPLDYRTSYLILTLLQSVGGITCHEISGQLPPHAAIVRQHMISQLLALGLWKWAIFVCLQIEDNFQRDHIVKEIVLMWAYGEKTTESEVFAADRLKVPRKWLKEAAAWRAGYNRSFDSQVHELFSSGLVDQAMEVISSYIAPHAFQVDAVDSPRLESILQICNVYGETKVGMDGMRTRCDVLGAFFAVQKDLDSLRLDLGSGANAVPALTSMMTIVGNASQLLKDVARGRGLDIATPISPHGNELTPFDIMLKEMGKCLYDLLARSNESLVDLDSNFGVSLLDDTTVSVPSKCRVKHVNQKNVNYLRHCSGSLIEKLANPEFGYDTIGQY